MGPIPKPQKWCFLVGCYNSGTTLLHEILSTHPSIASLPNEGQFLTDALPLPRELGLPRLWALKPELFELGKEDGKKVNVRRLKKQWGARINYLDRPVIIEKSPTNAARILWLQQNFENSYFVGIVRNGYAVAEGIRRKAKHSIEKCAQQWSVSNKILLRDLPQATNNLLVRYEELAEHPEKTIGRILEFLGLAQDDFLPLAGDWSIHEKNSEIRNMNDRSFKALSGEEIQLIQAVAQPMLSQLGYSVPNP
jgi:hypothetical protein